MTGPHHYQLAAALPFATAGEICSVSLSPDTATRPESIVLQERLKAIVVPWDRTYNGNKVPHVTFVVSPSQAVSEPVKIVRGSAEHEISQPTISCTPRFARHVIANGIVGGALRDALEVAERSMRLQQSVGDDGFFRFRNPQEPDRGFNMISLETKRAIDRFFTCLPIDKKGDLLYSVILNRENTIIDLLKAHSSAAFYRELRTLNPDREVLIDEYGRPLELSDVYSSLHGAERVLGKKLKMLRASFGELIQDWIVEVLDQAYAEGPLLFVPSRAGEPPVKRKPLAIFSSVYAYANLVHNNCLRQPISLQDRLEYLCDIAGLKTSASRKLLFCENTASPRGVEASSIECSLGAWPYTLVEKIKVSLGAEVIRKLLRATSLSEISEELRLIERALHKAM